MNLALLPGFGWALRQRSSHPRWTWAIRAPLEARWANCVGSWIASMVNHGKGGENHGKTMGK